jgi:hypothetical protein
MLELFIWVLFMDLLAVIVFSADLDVFSVGIQLYTES